MQILVAMDSFKGSLSSLDAGQAVCDGILEVFPKAQLILSPLADGGEGTVQALTLGLGGNLFSVSVTGPLGEAVSAEYGILPNGTAVIEMAAAAGLPLVPKEKRNPLLTTTYGVGEVIQDAIYRGCRQFIIGIGGSATNDGGAGMLSALGYRFMDAEGHLIPLGAIGLETLESIDDSCAMPELRECQFRVACDVSNPLLGPLGCSAVFGPQKGATEEMVHRMDICLSSYGRLVQALYFHADPDSPGAGAAGGLGFAFSAFLRARLEPGAQIVAEACDLERKIRDADLIITGEGQLDGQSVMGKAPGYIAKLAQKYNKKVIAFAGSIGKDAELCNQHGIQAYFSVVPCAMSLAEAMKPSQAYQNIKNTVQQVFRLL